MEQLFIPTIKFISVETNGFFLCNNIVYHKKLLYIKAYMEVTVSIS